MGCEKRENGLCIYWPVAVTRVMATGIAASESRLYPRAAKHGDKGLPTKIAVDLDQC